MQHTKTLRKQLNTSIPLALLPGLLTVLVLIWAQPAQTADLAPLDTTYNYGWENDGTLLSSYGNLSAAANVASGIDPIGPITVTPHGGSAMLQMTESPHEGTPQGYIAYIENLSHGDVITASFWGWDQTPGASPSLRIWAHYAQSGDVDSYAGSAGGNSSYTAGTGWSQLSWTWTFDSDGDTRDALVIEVRLYSTPSTGAYSTDYWIDDVQVVAPDSATVSFPAAAAPEIDVSGKGVSIPDGDTTPATADDTDFGSVGVSDGSVAHVFTISNTGEADLNLTGTPAVTLTSGVHFSVSTQPGSSAIPPGNATTFQITFDPAMVGGFTDTVSIANNDPDRTPYTFVILGIGESYRIHLPIVLKNAGY